MERELDRQTDLQTDSEKKRERDTTNNISNKERERIQNEREKSTSRRIRKRKYYPYIQHFIEYVLFPFKFETSGNEIIMISSIMYIKSVWRIRIRP